MIISLALSLIAIASGALLTYTWDQDAPLASRLCSGTCIGFALLGLVGLAFALLIGLTNATLIVTALALATPALLLRNPHIRTQIEQDLNQATRAISRATTRPDRWAVIYFLFYAAVGIGMWLVFSRAMFEKPEGIYTGVLNNYGDLPFHLSVITRFAFGQNFPPEDPTFAGARFTYPFITDLVSAMFVRAGASLRDSLFIENYFVGVALVGVLHRFGQKLLRNRTAAILTPVRGFLLGIPLAVIVFTQWWASMQSIEEGKGKKVKGKKEERWEKRLKPGRNMSGGVRSTVDNSSLFPFSFFLLPATRRMLAAGVVAGLLPLVHAHSFIVVMGVGACLALINWSRWREWLAFFVVASVISIPQLLWSTHGSAVSTRAFIGWEFGWDSGNANFFWFWFKNTGLFIPLLVAALLWKTDDYLVPRKLLFFVLPFTFCFIVPNMIKLAPWIWDNVKVLFYWWIASAPIVALLLARLWEGRAWHRTLAGGLLLVLTLAGALDIFALITNQGEYQEFDRDGVTFAEMIKQQTPPSTTILHAPIHNTPVFLTGRRSLMGYPGHIWTHGIDFGQREADIKKIYSGAPDAASLLGKYGVDYVVIDPQERSVMTVSQDFFSSYPEVVKIGEYHLYKIKP